MLSEITPLILTFNEAPNIARTLDRLPWANDIVVVDSFSNDQTLEIVSEYPQVRVLQRQFTTFADQCNYGLECGDIRTEWVLNLDADYVLTQEMVSELRGLSPEEFVNGFKAGFIYCVHGKRLRSGIYPSLTVLFRKTRAKFVSDGHAHRVVVEGRVLSLRSRILHDDRKPFERWFQAQQKYAELEATKLRETSRRSLGLIDRMRLWCVIAPPAMLLYCLVLRGGLFDGWAGFYYAFQRTLAELMLSLQLLDQSMKSPEAAGARADELLKLNEPASNLDVQRTKV